VLASIYAGEILSVCADETGTKPRAAVGQLWHLSVEEFKQLVHRAEGDGAPSGTARFTEEIRATLLLAVVSEEGLEQLRTQSMAAVTRDAQACPWFQHLGDLVGASAPAIMAMRLLAEAADKQAKAQARAEEAERQRIADESAVREAEQRRLEAEERNAAIAGTIGGVLGAVVGFFAFGVGTFVAILVLFLVTCGFFGNPKLLDGMRGPTLMLLVACIGAVVGANRWANTLKNWYEKRRRRT
jgi:hypothetical protein